MRDCLRRWWPVLKVVLALIVVAGVSWHLWRILRNEELSRGESRSPAEVLGDAIQSAGPVALVQSGWLYLAGLGFSAAFWIGLTRSLGERLPVGAGVRAYYLSHLGKYVPGKAVALVVRTTLAAGAGCRPGIAVLTAVYETLTTMAAGSLLAAALLLTGGDAHEGLVWKALALLVLAGVPILPGVFNRVVERLARRFLKAGPGELPRVQAVALPVGLVGTALGWVLLGASLEAMTAALSPDGSTPGLVRSTTVLAVAQVAGFVASTPGGLGVRELLLQQMLAPYTGDREAVVLAVLLRLLWTVAELVMAAVVWWLPAKQPEPLANAQAL